MKGIITTNSGIDFDLLIPKPEMVNIEDIAHHLSKLDRFTGALDTFYPVALHSIYCSYIVPREHSLEALLHDAAEAYLGDVSSPLKQCLPDYRKMEKMIYEVIANKFGIPSEMSPVVKLADKQAYINEKKTHFSAARGIDNELHGHLKDLKPMYFPIPISTSWKITKEAFLYRFEQLTTNRSTEK